jgi:ribosome-associated protein
MDYVDFIVHVFSTEKRAFYGLERLRKTATVLSIADLNAQLASQTKAVVAAGRKKVAVGKKTLPAKKSAAKTSTVKKATTRTTATKAASKAAAKPAKKAVKAVAKKAAKKK